MRHEDQVNCENSVEEVETYDKRRFLVAAGIIAVLVLLAMVGRAIGNRCYTFDWILRRKMYLYAAIITIVFCLCGNWSATACSFAGMFLGVGLGEWLGAPETGGSPDIIYFHYGWLVWIITYLCALVIGVILKRMKMKRNL